MPLPVIGPRFIANLWDLMPGFRRFWQGRRVRWQQLKPTSDLLSRRCFMDFRR